MPNQIVNVPLAILQKIFRGLSQNDIVNVKLVCKKWLEISSSLESTAVGIEKVPPEVLENIFKVLEQEDIANARLVCKKWMIISSPLYLDTVNITLRNQPLILADSIAEHKLFRSGIKVLVIDMARFSGHLALDWRQYANAVIEQLLKEMESNIGDERETLALAGHIRRWRNDPTVSVESLEMALREFKEDEDHQSTINLLIRGWWEYLQLFEQQEAILRRSELVDMVKRVLALMPGVRHLRFKSSWSYRRSISSISDEADRNCLRQYCLEPKVDDRIAPPQLVDFFEVWSMSGRPLRSFEASSRAMLLAAMQRPLTPRSMAIFKHTREIWIHYGSALMDIRHALHNIEAERIQSGYLATLLSGASSVERINLSGAINLFLTDIPVTLDSVLGNTYWENLRSLCLITIEIEFKELEGLCERQQDTLEVLVIQRAGLFGGTWARALPVIRRLKKLHHTFLSFLWHGKQTDFIVDYNSELAVRTYILQGGRNPLEPPHSPSP